MDDTRKALVEGLNDLLEGEFIAMIHYAQHAGSVGGLNYETLSRALMREAADEMGHAVKLTQMILSLGGVPDWEVGRSHPFAQHEVADARTLLEHDLEHEREMILRYSEVARLADEAGEPGVKILLETILGEEQDELQVLQRMLATAGPSADGG